MAVLGWLAAFVAIFAHEGAEWLGYALLSASLGYAASWLAAGRGAANALGVRNGHAVDCFWTGPFDPIGLRRHCLAGAAKEPSVR